MRASLARPSFSATSARVSTSAAAPSEMEAEDAAVIAPSLAKTGLSDGIFSGLALPGCSSLSTWTNSRSEEHPSELQSLMRKSYAVFCLQKKQPTTYMHITTHT